LLEDDGFADGVEDFDAPAPIPAPDPSAVDGLRPDFGLGGPPPDGQQPAERTGPARRPLIIGGAVLAGLLVIALVLVLRNQPEELATTPRTPPAPAPTSTPESRPAATVALELAEPTDLGDQIVLNWTAAAPNLDFAVVVAADGEPKQVKFAGRNHTMTIPVDPSHQYCFLVQATDKVRIYESQPKAVHGAVCHL
jgi:hypothetical protein